MEGRTRIRKLSGYHFKMRLLSKYLVDCYDYPLFARGHLAPQLAEESSKSVSCVRSFSLFASSSMPGKLEDDSWIASTGWGIGFTRPSVPASPSLITILPPASPCPSPHEQMRADLPAAGIPWPSILRIYSRQACVRY